MFLGAAVAGFGVVDGRTAVVLAGAVVLVAAGIGRDYGPGGKEARDRRPVAWTRLLLALAAGLALGVVLGALDTPAWLVLVLFAALGAAACTRPVDNWIHKGRAAHKSSR